LNLVDSIVSGKIFWHNRLMDAAIAIDNGKIVDIGLESSLPKADRYYRFDDKIILPGLIDVHVHLRDQDLSYKETFESGSMAAAAGGFTTILDMPNNSPPTDSPQRFKDRVDLARDKIYVNVGFYSLFPKSLSEIYEITALGAIGFKVYLNKPIGFIDPSDDEIMKSYLKVCGEIDIPVVFHAEDYATIASLEEKFKHSSSRGFMGFIESHPVNAEVKAVSRILNFVSQYNCRVHIAHVTSGLILDLISKFKRFITCEVTPHHLLLTYDYLKFLGGIGKVEPPLRSIFDSTSLWFNLSRGVIDVIADDHAPHSIEEKVGDDFGNIKSGFPGLETTVPLMLTALNYGLLDMESLVKLMSLNPSKIFNLRGKGSIDIGFDADLTIVDLNYDWIIDSSKFFSKAKFSPFDGFKVKGRVYSTFVGGLMVYHDGEILCRGGDIILGCGVRS